MVTASVLLALHPDGPMGHDRLESAMFWVGAMLAFMPVLVLVGVFGFVWWHRRRRPDGNEGAPGEAEGPLQP